MTDYIKREDVDTYFNNRNAWYNFYETLESIPSADVVEVKHGKWIFKPLFPNDKRECPIGHLECSICGSHHSNSMPCNYCDNCGAKMDGEES